MQLWSDDNSPKHSRQFQEAQGTISDDNLRDTATFGEHTVQDTKFRNYSDLSKKFRTVQVEQERETNVNQ